MSDDKLAALRALLDEAGLPGAEIRGDEVDLGHPDLTPIALHGVPPNWRETLPQALAIHARGVASCHDAYARVLGLPNAAEVREMRDAASYVRDALGAIAAHVGVAPDEDVCRIVDGAATALDALRAERDAAVAQRDRALAALARGDLLRFEAGTFALGGPGARTLMAALAEMMLGVQNYVESVVIAGGGQSYALTLRKSTGATPHELRAAAEAERDAVRARAEKAEARCAALLGALTAAFAEGYGGESTPDGPAPGTVACAECGAEWTDDGCPDPNCIVCAIFRSDAARVRELAHARSADLPCGHPVAWASLEWDHEAGEMREGCIYCEARDIESRARHVLDKALADEAAAVARAEQVEADAAAMREAITNAIYEINAQRDDVGAATVLIDSVAETWVRMLRAALENRRG